MTTVFAVMDWDSSDVSNLVQLSKYCSFTWLLSKLRSEDRHIYRSVISTNGSFTDYPQTTQGSIHKIFIHHMSPYKSGVPTRDQLCLNIEIWVNNQ